jgi:hypothetical protein
MKAEIDGKDLVITIVLEKPRPSKSGKTLVVCSSRGVRTLSVKVNGHPIHIVLNGFIYPEERELVARNKSRDMSEEDGDEEDCGDEEDGDEE